MLENDVRRFRERAGLTQQELAARSGITRQTVNALEAGRYAPSTLVALRIARVLGCRVEDLFHLDDAEAELPDVVIAAGPPAAERAAVTPEPALLGRVGERWVAHRLAGDAPLPGNALIEAEGAGRARIVPLVRPEILAGTLLVAGCAPALAVLSQRVVERLPGRFLHWIDATSTRALDLLDAGHVHVAGTHLLDEASGEFNHPIVATRFGGRRMLCVTFARWEQGIVLRRADRDRIRGVDDLVRPDVRIAAREEGAGAQKLVARLLRRRGIEPPPGSSFARGHMDVARQVSSGAADAGIAVRAAALAFGLDFLPLADERFDLVLPAERADDRPVADLLDLIAGRAFRRELSALGGYDVTRTGDATLVAGAAA